MLTLIRCPFHPHVTAVARKRPRSFYQKCRWQVTPKHSCTFDPTKSEWADYAVVQALCGNLIRKRVHTQLNTRSQSSQLAELMWSIPGVKSGLCVRKLISTLKKKKKKRRRRTICRTVSQYPHTRGKSHHHQSLIAYFAYFSFVLCYLLAIGLFCFI